MSSNVLSGTCQALVCHIASSLVNGLFVTVNHALRVLLVLTRLPDNVLKSSDHVRICRVNGVSYVTAGVEMATRVAGTNKRLLQDAVELVNCHVNLELAALVGLGLGGEDVRVCEELQTPLRVIAIGVVAVQCPIGCNEVLSNVREGKGSECLHKLGGNVQVKFLAPGLLKQISPTVLEVVQNRNTAGPPTPSTPPRREANPTLVTLASGGSGRKHG